MADVGVKHYNTSEPPTGGDSLGGDLNIYYDVSVKRGLTIGFGQTRLTMAVK